MKKRVFKKLINLSIDKGKKEKIIYDNGLDLINFMNDYSEITNILLKSIYGEETSDIITDFIFDSIYDELEINKENYIIYKDDIILAEVLVVIKYQFGHMKHVKIVQNHVKPLGNL